MMTLHFQY